MDMAHFGVYSCSINNAIGETIMAIDLDNKWMAVALEEAAAARSANELPIGGVLVADGKLIARTQTSVHRRGSMAAHGELICLLELKENIFTLDRPIVLYTTLEPCAMCLGAAAQCGLDEVVYGMRCLPDGASAVEYSMRQADSRVPALRGGVMERECVREFSKWAHGESHPAFNYVKEILDFYS